jgi:hypothetical protein
MKCCENCRDFPQNCKRLVPPLEQETINNETLFPLVARADVVREESKVLRSIRGFT